MSVAVIVFLGAAAADNKPTVSVKKPLAAAVVSGTQVEIEIAYRSNSGKPIVRAEAYIDRQFRFGGDIEPSLSGTSRFLWDTTLYPDGAHSLGAAAVDADGNAGSVTVNVKIGNVHLPMPSGPLSIAIVSPAEGEEVKGTVDVLVQAQENADVAWVSYFIDGNFWAARNFRPFLQRWDTSESADGKHLISVTAFGPDETKATASVTVFVNNSGAPTLVAAPEQTEPEASEQVVEMTRLPGLESAAFAPPGEQQAVAEAVALEGIALDTDLLPDAAVASTEIPAVGPQPADTFVMLPAPPVSGEVVPPPSTALPAETEVKTPEAGTGSPTGEEAGALVLAPQLPESGTGALQSEPVVAPVRPETSLASVPVPAPASAVGTTAPSPAPVVAELPAGLPEGQLALPGGTNLTAAGESAGESAGAAQQEKPSPATVVMLPPQSARKELAPLGEGIAPPAAPALPHFTTGLPIVYYDGEPITFPDVPAHVYKGMCLVPVRFLIENKGGTAMWFPEDQRVELRTGDGTTFIQMQLGSKEILVNGKKEVMPIRAYLLPPGRTIVPLRFFSRILDADIVYDPSTGDVSLASRSPEAQSSATVASH